MYCHGRYLADLTKKSKRIHSSNTDLPYTQSNSARPRVCFSPSDSFISLAACKATIKPASLFRNWPSGNHSLQSAGVQGQPCQRHGPAATATVATGYGRGRSQRPAVPGHAHRPHLRAALQRARTVRVHACLSCVFVALFFLRVSRMTSQPQPPNPS